MSLRRRLFGVRPTAPAARRTAGLRFEQLEAREVPTVALAGIADSDIPNNKPLFVPVTPTAAPAGAVRYTATTSDPANVTAEVVSGGRTVKLDVTGTDSAGVAFSGSLTLRLFEDVAPLATGEIISLVQSGFYNGKLFHRILDNFVIQGGSPNGDGQGGSSLPDVADEFNSQYTFASSGIVAMANAGDDNNNSQFFITDIDQPLSGRPQSLNFNHTIVGQLTSGFDIFQKIITTTVTTSASGERGSPVNPVTITNASVLDDTANGVIKITAKGTPTGPVTVTVTGTDSTGAGTPQTFAVNVVPDTVNDRAFLNTIAPVTVVSGGSGSFTIPATDLDNDTLTYAVGTPGNLFGTPANATVAVDQASGKVTVTPAAGFTGTVSLLVGVRDQTDRVGSLNSAGNYDTQTVNVTVSAPNPATTTTITPARTSTTTGTPVLLTADVSGTGSPTGTVQFLANGVQIGSAAVTNGRAVFNATFTTAGAQAVQASFVPADSSFTASQSAATTVTVTAATTTPPVNISATGSAAGSEPRVTVTNGDGTQLSTFLAFEPGFTGGVRVATADVTNDGVEDVVVTAGFGGSPIVRVFNATTGVMTNEIMVFEESFRGGLYLDVGDALGRGYAQILVGAGYNGGPRVTLYDFVTGKAALNYFAYDPNFRGGVSVNLSDLRGDSQPQIITGAGKGGGPQVNVYNPRTSTNSIPTQEGASFEAGDVSNTAGIRVGAGGLLANNTRNILVGPFEPDSAPLDQSYDPTAVGVFVG